MQEYVALHTLRKQQANDVRYFGGEFTVDMLAVHPQYWRKSHGSSLLLWITQLVDKDSIKLGVAAVPMAIHIYCKVGFAKKDEVKVEECKAFSRSD